MLKSVNIHNSVFSLKRQQNNTKIQSRPKKQYVTRVPKK